MVERVTTKSIADFTGMLHLRHPNELGGAYWLFNMLYTQASVFVVLNLGSATSKEAIIQVNGLRIIAGVLAGLWVVAIATLLKFSEVGFRHTFFSKLTCRGFQMKCFEEGDDRTKLAVITSIHRAICSSFNDDMKEWLADSWDELHHTKPSWFTEEVRTKRNE